MRDAQKRVKAALEDVLKEYGLTWQDTRTKRHDAVEFYVGDKRFTHIYSAGGLRDHLNARSDLRNRLKMLGLQPVEHIPQPVLAAEKHLKRLEPLEEELPVEPIEAIAPPVEESEEAPVMDEAVEPNGETEAETQPETQSQPQRPDPSTANISSLKAPVRGYVYQSPRVIAIELDRELIVEAGNFLVIPLNRPNTIWPMTKEQFQTLFEQVAEEPEPEEPEVEEPIAPVARMRRPAPRRPEARNEQREQPRPQQRERAATPMSPAPLRAPRLILPIARADEEAEGEEYDVDMEGEEYGEGTASEVYGEGTEGEGTEGEGTETGEVEEYGEAEEDDAEEVERVESEDVNDLIAYLKQRRGAVKTKVIAESLGKTMKSVDNHLRRMANRGMVESGPPGFWTLLPNVPMPQAPKTRTTRQMEQEQSRLEEEQPRRGGTRMRGPIPAQLGRILAAMAFASKSTGKIDLTTSMVTRHLDARDAKQYSARVPGAVESGYAERGLALPDNQRGWHYRITESGLKALKAAGTFPYDADDLEPPDWLETL